MSASFAELHQLLADLGDRRERLLALVGPEDQGQADLLADLTELSEQLLVADEELRVQQEELEDTRTQLTALVADRDALLAASPDALVVTDSRGLVLQSTRVADTLIRQPMARYAPRPIATWFEVKYRNRIRQMIRHLGRDQLVPVEPAVLRRSDGMSLPVLVEVLRSSQPGDPGYVLRWKLTPAHQQRLDLRVVPDSAPLADRPLADLPSADALAELATEFANQRSLDALVTAVSAAAVRLIPGAERAALRLDAGGSAAAAPAGWVPDAPADPDGGSRLRVILTLSGRELGELTCHASARDAFDADAERVAELVASHAAVALRQVLAEQQVQDGLRSRQEIGQAVGILMERHRLTSDTAFALLVRRSQHTNIKLRRLAQLVVETGQDPAQILAR